jgi:hypothetical protein
MQFRGEQMKLFDLFARFSLAGIFLIMAFMLQPGTATGQSTDETRPTPIAAFPLTGTLGSGTYYYEIPETLVSEGEVNATLTFTPPTGGGSMTASFSGPRCCSGEATVGESTGYAESIRRSTTFSIPGQQNLLITVYVSVAAKQTVRFSLNLSAAGAPSGIIITPPPAPTPTTPTGGVCTDLGVDGFVVTGETGLTKEITGRVRNLTTTHPYKGYRRLQWLEVFDITDSEKGPPLVTRIAIPEIIEAGASFSYSAVHTLTVRRRTRYKVQIRYSPYNATDRSQYNDDCNSSNNSTRRQLVGILTADEPPQP